MADLIERDALLKYMCGACLNPEAQCIQTECYLYREKKRIEAAPAVNRWIPCSERLPEGFSWCLVCMADGFIRLGRWNAKYDDAGAWQVLMQNGDKMYRIKTVPHWMPLPEPPEVTQDDNG